MRVIDGHCDVLSKMLMDPFIEFTHDAQLDVTLPRMKAVRMMMQSFAVYLPEKLHNPGFGDILKCIDLFHSKVLAASDEMLHVRTGQDMETLLHGNKIGALLALEGADGLEGNFTYLRTLFYLGVRSLGITWNYANWAADGILEPRKGGLTYKGTKLVKECNKLGIILDVSHLSEKGFWELTELTEKPFIASHSNAYDICPHPRNLRKNQIEAIVRMEGRVGITFVPWFVREQVPVSIEHLLPHIDRMFALGGVRNVGFGSDFDGIDKWIVGLENTKQYDRLVNLLHKHYKSAEVEGLLWRNWYDFYIAQLPSSI